MAAPSPSPWISGSTYTLEAAQGTHVFKIDGYSLSRGIGVSNCIKSATFAVGGYDWCLLIYPDGVKEDTKDWVAAFLEVKTENAEVRATWDLRLIDQTTRPWTNSSHRGPDVFNNSAAWGHDKLVNKSEIEEHLMDDALIIVCNITVINLMDAEDSDFEIIGDVCVPPSDLVDDLSELLETTEGADISFKVKEEVFPAHKIILATRSPVFRADFYGPMRDEHRRSITVEDMQPAVFRGLLHFIYTDSLPPMDELNSDEHEEMLRHLLVAADRYAMRRMKLVCEQKLCTSLNAESVATTLALADQHHCTKLKDACIEFMTSSNRVDDVVASKDYQRLKRSCPTIFADLWERAAKTGKKKHTI